MSDTLTGKNGFVRQTNVAGRMIRPPDTQGSCSKLVLVGYNMQTYIIFPYVALCYVVLHTTVFSIFTVVVQ